MIQQGDALDLEITTLTAGGDGLGHYEGRAIFVSDSVPGDQLRIRITEAKKIVRGKILEVVQPSNHRVRPPCIVADKCGGCQWQAVSYATQLAQKKQIVIDSLVRIGGFEHPPVEEVLGAEDPLHYRNKSTFPVGANQQGKIMAGYYRKQSHDLINLNQCPVQDEKLNSILEKTKALIQEMGWSAYHEKNNAGYIRHLGLRIGRRTDKVLLTLVTTELNLPNLEKFCTAIHQQFRSVVSICLNLNDQPTNAIFGPQTKVITGKGFIQEQFCGLEFQVGPTTFFQVNTEQAEQTIRKLLEIAQFTKEDKVVDAYSGIGTLSLPIAQHVKKVIAIESFAPSVQQAQLNAQNNRIGNVAFLAGTVEDQLAEVLQPEHTLILDPPRKGCDPSVLEVILKKQPRRLFYLSCNPSTLARDLKHLSTQYELKMVIPIDFFPQTYHVEALSYLERKVLS
jgi:23S rRNA (uracil1939-C5)-methyltransferase